MERKGGGEGWDGEGRVVGWTGEVEISPDVTGIAGKKKRVRF